MLSRYLCPKHKKVTQDMSLAYLCFIYCNYSNHYQDSKKLSQFRFLMSRHPLIAKSATSHYSRTGSHLAPIVCNQPGGYTVHLHFITAHVFTWLEKAICMTVYISIDKSTQVSWVTPSSLTHCHNNPPKVFACNLSLSQRDPLLPSSHLTLSFFLRKFSDGGRYQRELFSHHSAQQVSNPIFPSPKPLPPAQTQFILKPLFIIKAVRGKLNRTHFVKKMRFLSQYLDF